MHRPIIYLNRKQDLNDIYIIVTLYQYYRNYIISQLVTGLPTARVYGHIPIAMIYAVQGYMSILQNIEVSVNQTLNTYIYGQQFRPYICVGTTATSAFQRVPNKGLHCLVQ